MTQRVLRQISPVDEMAENFKRIGQRLASLERAASSGDDGGEPGPPIVVAFVHNQGTPAEVWTITHNLGWHPNVTVIDSAGSTVEGDVLYLSTNQLRLTFSGAFTGVAYLS